jgi:hypothetical protein
MLTVKNSKLVFSLEKRTEIVWNNKKITKYELSNNKKKKNVFTGKSL